MPSYTFVATANAFVLRGAKPVFVDIRPDTLNLDEKLVEAAVTSRTKAIAVVHYAGVGCEMDTIMDIARRHKLMVIEDAAQGIHSTYKGKPLGAIGHLAALSFHETKNVISGEGGALLVNDPALAERADIIWEKGTNRSKFLRGQVDKYTWVDVGSSFLPSELIAAFLWPQLEDTVSICKRRLDIWQAYHVALKPLRDAGRIQGPIVPEGCVQNAHMYYFLARDAGEQHLALERLKAVGIGALFHYVPLHSSPGGLRFARTHGELKVTDDIWSRLIRLPLWPDMLPEDIEQVSAAVKDALGAGVAKKHAAP